jgi:hypothetical protein
MYRSVMMSAERASLTLIVALSAIGGCAKHPPSPAKESSAGDQPQAQPLDPDRLLLKAPDQLGIHDPVVPEGEIHHLEITPKMRKRGSRLYAGEARPWLASKKCYAVAAAVPKDTELFLYAGNPAGDMISEDNNRKRGVALVGACIASINRLNLVFITTRPTTVSYRIFSRSNFMQAEQERDVRAFRERCLADCSIACERHLSDCGAVLESCRGQCIHETTLH